jgi:NAD(P) transhydrogenase subunit alpha
MRIAIVNERAAGERRVALVPDSVSRLAAAGHAVVVERGAGLEAGHDDADYEAAGATLAGDRGAALDGADVVVLVQRPGLEGGIAVDDLHVGSLVVGLLAPLDHPACVAALAARGVDAIALERIPRTSRAQSMEVLSSMASIAGYRAALIGAQRLGRFYPLLMTAAGTVAPAKVLVLGAGVAGLQAIATARRLGAVVSANDTRAVVREQVESLGAKFVVLQSVADAAGEGGYARALTDEEQAAQREELAGHIAAHDVVITTALVPGMRAPLLVPADVVHRMRRGSVVVDLAGAAGGNCELSVLGQDIDADGVHVLAPDNLPATMATHASQLFAKNVENLVALLAGEDGALDLDVDDDIVQAALTVRGGEVRDEAVLSAIDAGGDS